MDPAIKQPGVLVDTRTEKEKEGDIRIEELVASFAPVSWETKPPSQWRRFPIFNQDGSGSCVAQTLKKQIGVHIWQKTGVWVDLSASHIYQRRANKPAPGMNAVDAYTIAGKSVTLEAFAPSERLTDGQMDGIQVLPFMDEIGKVFAIGKPIEDPTQNIESAASVIQQTGKAVMVWFYFRYDEWTDVPTVKDPNLSIFGPDTVRHSVPGVEYTLWDGKKAVIIEDSWGPTFGLEGRRVITEDFFKARNFYVSHFMNFKFEEAPLPEKPKYTFLRDLEFSPVFHPDPDVAALQDILKFEGLFPLNVDSTGYFGAVTRDSVGKFQVKHGIAVPGGAGYGRVGPKTRGQLNSLYSA